MRCLPTGGALARKAFVYLVKKYGAIKNREICEIVGSASVSPPTKNFLGVRAGAGRRCQSSRLHRKSGGATFNIQGPTLAIFASDFLALQLGAGSGKGRNPALVSGTIALLFCEKEKP